MEAKDEEQEKAKREEVLNRTKTMLEQIAQEVESEFKIGLAGTRNLVNSAYSLSRTSRSVVLLNTIENYAVERVNMFSTILKKLREYET